MSDSSAVVDLPPAPPHLANDPVLRNAKEGLRRIYGDRLAGVVVYGSRARGDERPNSDYDLIVLIKDFDPVRDRRRELHQLGDELFRLEPHEIEVNFLPVDASALSRRTIFMHNVREEGVRL